MKRMIFGWACLVLMVKMLPAAGITLTAPNGFEYWGLGSTYKITWTGDKMKGPLRLMLMSGNRSIGDIAVNLPLRPSEFLWTAGELVPGSAGQLAFGSAKVARYRVRILDQGTGRQDDSNNEFNLVGAMSHEITSPQLGSVWNTGSTHVIRWKNEGKAQAPQLGADEVKIHLIFAISSGEVATIAKTENDGQYEWLIPHSILLSEYRVRIDSGTPGASSYKYGTSQAFRIQPKIVVSKPEENARFSQGDHCDISWSVQGQGYSSTAMIYLMDPQLKNKAYTVANVPTAAGHHQWLIPPPAAVANGSYRIQLEIRGAPYSNVIATGASKAFRIGLAAYNLAPGHKFQQRQIKVTAPTDWIVWKKGNQYDITWTKKGDLGPFVQIMLFKSDRSQYVMNCSGNVDNSGSYRWQVPAGVPDGTYSIRVENPSTGTKGWSANFYIRK